VNGLAELRHLACDQIRADHPTIPDAVITPPPYTDRSANGLTKAICDYIRLSGGYAVRINTTGQFRAGKWVKGTTRRGTADVHAVYRGLHLSIEIKIGQDRQSIHQKKTEAEVEAAGGIYYLARDFQSFYDWIQTLKEKARWQPDPKTLKHPDNERIYKKKPICANSDQWSGKDGK
jgi:hypothetical protein